MKENKRTKEFNKNLLILKKIRNLKGLNLYVIKHIDNDIFIDKNANETEDLLKSNYFDSKYSGTVYLKQLNLPDFVVFSLSDDFLDVLIDKIKTLNLKFIN